MSPLPNKPLPTNKFALRAALASLDEQGIEIGSIVTASWVVPENHATEGETRRSHTGPLVYLDRDRGYFQISPSNRSPGHYRGYLMGKNSTLTLATEQVELVTTKPNNPFIDRPKAPPPAKPVPNPFVEKQKKQRPVTRPHGKPPNPFLKGK